MNKNVTTVYSGFALLLNGLCVCHTFMWNFVRKYNFNKLKKSNIPINIQIILCLSNVIVKLGKAHEYCYVYMYLTLYAPRIILQYVYKTTRCTKFLRLDFIFIKCSTCFGLY